MWEWMVVRLCMSPCDRPATCPGCAPPWAQSQLGLAPKSARVEESTVLWQDLTIRVHCSSSTERSNNSIDQQLFNCTSVMWKIHQVAQIYALNRQRASTSQRCINCYCAFWATCNFASCLTVQCHVCALEASNKWNANHIKQHWRCMCSTKTHLATVLIRRWWKKGKK